MPFSNYSNNLVQDHMMRDATWSKSTTRYVCLLTADPTAAGTGTTIVELTDGGYARVQVDADNDNWNRPTDGVIENAVAIEFGPFEGTVTPTHFAVVDASTAGNMLWYGTVSASADACEKLQFAAGDLSSTLA